MPSITVHEHVAAPRDLVFRLACRIEDIQKYAEPVQKIEIVERGDGYVVSAWKVLLQGRPLHWTERDEFDEANYVIRYKQVKGDLAKFEGDWTFVERDGGTDVTLRVDFDLGIPMLAGLLNPIATALTKKSSEALVKAIKQQAEEAAGA